MQSKSPYNASPSTGSTNSSTILSTSSAVPVRMVSSMNRLLNHTISSPSTTCPMPATMDSFLYNIVVWHYVMVLRVNSVASLLGRFFRW